jgi:cobyrinic acid a,c-diamide synthase
LVTVEEWDQVSDLLDDLGQQTEKYVDLQAVLKIAASAGSLPPVAVVRQKTSDPIRIGVIRDHVFSFYYPENMEALEDQGAELIYINSLADKCLPDIQGLYIGGGFPEVFGEQLERNISLRSSIHSEIINGLPVYAECGGLMYLCRNLVYNGQSYEMCGVLPCDTQMSSKPHGHGYTRMETIKSNYIFAEGSEIRGHEFHHSQICNADENTINFLFQVERGYGLDGKRDGIAAHNVIASYNHIYAPSCPVWAANFIARARQYRKI